MICAGVGLPDRYMYFLVSLFTNKIIFPLWGSLSTFRQDKAGGLVNKILPLHLKKYRATYRYQLYNDISLELLIESELCNDFLEECRCFNAETLYCVQYAQLHHHVSRTQCLTYPKTNHFKKPYFWFSVTKTITTVLSQTL